MAITSPATAAIKTANQEQFIESNPINSCLFDWLPRYILSRNDIPAALKLILMVMYGALRKDCKVTFRVATLARRTGLSEATVKRAIKKGRELGLFITVETGRALRFRLIDQSNKLIHEVDQNDPSLIKEQKKDLKETTTAPDHEPIQEPPPKIATQKGPGGPVVDLKKIKEIIDPVIYNAIGSITMKKLCSGKGFETIKFASDRAMKLPLKGKTGLFINTLNDPPPMALSTIGQEVKIKHDMPMQQQQAIKCYNDNIQKIEKNCSAMINGHTPTGNCASYCPYANRRLMK